MKIAVPTQKNDQIANQPEAIELYTIFCISDDNEIMAETILESPKDGEPESNVANNLAEMGVGVMLVNQIDDALIQELVSCKIHVICNCEGDIYELVEKYLAA